MMTSKNTLNNSDADVRRSNNSLFFVLAIFLSSPANAAEINLLKNDKVNAEEPAVSMQQSGAPKLKWALYAEQWELARSGDSVLSLAPLNQLVNSWFEDRSKKMEIQYPGGEEGEFWVQELSDWLVALGIPSDKIFLLVGSGADDKISLQLIRSETLIY